MLLMSMQKFKNKKIYDEDNMLMAAKPIRREFQDEKSLCYSVCWGRKLGGSSISQQTLMILCSFLEKLADFKVETQESDCSLKDFDPEVDKPNDAHVLRMFCAESCGSDLVRIKFPTKTSGAHIFIIPWSGARGSKNCNAGNIIMYGRGEVDSLNS